MWCDETFILGICTCARAHQHTHTHTCVRERALVWEVRCLMGSVARCPSPQCCIARICSLVPPSPPEPLFPSLQSLFLSFLPPATSELWKPWSFHLPVSFLWTVLLPFSHFPDGPFLLGPLESGPQYCIGSRSAHRGRTGVLALKEGVVVLGDQSCSGGSGIGLQNIKECMIVTEF